MVSGLGTLKIGDAVSVTASVNSGFKHVGSSIDSTRGLSTNVQFQVEWYLHKVKVGQHEQLEKGF